VHARIDASNDTPRARFLGDRLERRDPEQRQVVSEADSLCDAAGYAQAGERARAGAERHRVEPRRAEPRARQQLLEHRQQQLAVARSGALLERRDLAVDRQRDRAPLARCLDSRETHCAVSKRRQFYRRAGLRIAASDNGRRA